MIKLTKTFFSNNFAVCVIITPSSAELPSPRIINGTEATQEIAKFQVSIRLRRYDTSFGNGHICGGALIGPNKVLTAAHCLYEWVNYSKINSYVLNYSIWIHTIVLRSDKISISIWFILVFLCSKTYEIQTVYF